MGGGVFKQAQVHVHVTPPEGLQGSDIPIEPLSKYFHISVQEEEAITHTVIHRQPLITAAYACTDYRPQSQTVPAIVVDIESSPTGGLSLFNLYIALSCSQGSETIHLLQEFDEKYFKVTQVHELTAKDKRLGNLCRQTSTWWQHTRVSL
ncbi:hypothetical protein BDN67DRAFT_917087 [Paxillus ammoniavirescens]|nr:hypothetical protein BDN67DRAFT_917087 [Paxillus ammoniavirescens]